MKRDIESREDVAKLVEAFYTKVRQHQDIGPFFNETIIDWPAHLQKLTDFWETNLFFVNAYKGNPLKAHIDVDQEFNHSIEQAHFGNWLELWFSTIDNMYEGENAHLAKERARNMSHIMYIRIFQARQNKNIALN
ncbi:hemoglobin [Ekhidna lutea]|uniref:Hemoglobin n=1 Tax=Ekhidna lutea TaxID=447679 RepID=A0A239KI06_EKHLU|nr:group III truncated hemoglobin [Ekhidna lutea]SNT17811.1 hemoglobin [Ekhidna lutea]